MKPHQVIINLKKNQIHNCYGAFQIKQLAGKMLVSKRQNSVYTLDLQQATPIEGKH